jgi:diadenosine tetraphosphatase ApaH/serine/threonine PP2A family protein phosphatase
VHGNLEALTAVLEDMGAVDRLLCLGDVVGYGASPDACLRLLRDAAAEPILGNHELGLLGNLDLEWFNPWAQAALHWQRALISPEDTEWIRTWPATRLVEDMWLVHGAPPRSATTYTVTPIDVERAMRAGPWRTCLVGHSHLPGVFVDAPVVPGGIALRRWQRLLHRAGAPLPLGIQTRSLINPGSVGQPRDGVPLASYAVYDTTHASVTIRRVPYDIEGAQQRIRAAGLPPELADRLAVGK